MGRTRGSADAGYAMVALLVGLAIMAIALSVALPTWSTLAKREREEELIFRGQQYARAIALYQRRYANAFPPNFDVLVQQRFLRKRFRDPMTADGEFQPIYAGQPVPGQPQQQAGRGGRNGQGPQTPSIGQPQTPITQQIQQPQGGGLGANVNTGLIGVVSKSEVTGLRLFNGRSKYNEWAFVATQANTAAGAPGGGQRPGGPRGGTRPGGVGPGGGVDPGGGRQNTPFPGPAGGRRGGL